MNQKELDVAATETPEAILGRALKKCANAELSLALSSQVKETEAIKFDNDKLRFDLLPVRPLEEVAEVFRLGAIKYADRNWEKGFRWGRPFAACLRHVFAWWRGEDLDSETGCSHLAHAICCLLFLLEYRYTSAGVDDRVKA